MVMLSLSRYVGPSSLVLSFLNKYPDKQFQMASLIIFSSSQSTCHKTRKEMHAASRATCKLSYLCPTKWFSSSLFSTADLKYLQSRVWLVGWLWRNRAEWKAICLNKQCFDYLEILKLLHFLIIHKIMCNIQQLWMK